MSDPRTKITVTPEQEEIFWREYVRTNGNVLGATRAVWPDGKHSHYFRSRLIRDAAFRRESEKRLADAKDQLRLEIHKRAVEGVDEFVIQKAEVVHGPDGKPIIKKRYSDSLLKKMAESTLDEFKPTLEVVHKHEVDIRGYKISECFVITPDELLALSSVAQASLRTVLNEIGVIRGDHKPKEVEAKIKDTLLLAQENSDVVDAKFSEVEAEVDDETWWNQQMEEYKNGRG